MLDTRRPTVHLETLGCSKNEVDSAKVAGMLGSAGYLTVESADTADVVMINTCAFIESARQESIDTILDLAAAKRPDARLVVIGCMAQRYETELRSVLPEADAVVGLDRYPELVGTLDSLVEWQPLTIRPAVSPRMDILSLVARPTPTTPYAYVKVAEGCDKPCTFCAIPLFRGKQRSRTPVNIRDEIVMLTGAGVSEIVLVAQDLAAYGRDIDAPGGIVDLLRFVSDADGLRRLRLFYLYPREIRQPLIDEMAANPVVAPYFDLSLQHASAELLRAMKRPGSGDRHLELIDRIRAASPQAALRSSFIVGFPGESDDDIDQLAGFLETAELDWAGFFPYSAEEGTAAAGFASQIPGDEIAARQRHLQGFQDELTSLANAAQSGRVLDVLVDQVEDGVPVGRSYREAPEIDGVVVLDDGQPGEWVRVEITGGYGTDLVGAVLR